MTGRFTEVDERRARFLWAESPERLAFLEAEIVDAVDVLVSALAGKIQLATGVHSAYRTLSRCVVDLTKDGPPRKRSAAG